MSAQQENNPKGINRRKFLTLSALAGGAGLILLSKLDKASTEAVPSGLPTEAVPSGLPTEMDTIGYLKSVDIPVIGSLEAKAASADSEDFVYIKSTSTLANPSSPVVVLRKGGSESVITSPKDGLFHPQNPTIGPDGQVVVSVQVGGNLIGGGKRKVLQFPGKMEIIKTKDPQLEGLYSPDGSQIALVTMDSRANHHIHIVENGKIQRSFIGQSPTWSPDGQNIAFRRMGKGLVVTNVSGRERSLTGGGANPSWSPDGTRIVYEEGSSIHVISRDGGNSMQLNTGTGLSCSPSWLYDGRIVFSSATILDKKLSNFDLYSINPDGQGLHPLTNTQGVNEVTTGARN